MKKESIVVEIVDNILKAVGSWRKRKHRWVTPGADADVAFSLQGSQYSGGWIKSSFYPGMHVSVHQFRTASAKDLFHRTFNWHLNFRLGELQPAIKIGPEGPDHYAFDKKYDENYNITYQEREKLIAEDFKSIVFPYSEKFKHLPQILELYADKTLHDYFFEPNRRDWLKVMQTLPAAAARFDELVKAFGSRF